MPESGLSGSVRGARGNPRPYRDVGALVHLGKLCIIRAVAPESFALAGQGARSVVGSLPMSEEPNFNGPWRPGGAKARPLRGFAHKGPPAALPGLAIGMAMALRRDALHLRPCGPKRVSRELCRASLALTRR